MPLSYSASSDGNICYGPKIRYGTAIGGSPTYQYSNNILQWCQQLFPKSTIGTATYNSDDAVNSLYWCTIFDEKIPHWCYYGNGHWQDEILSNSIQTPCNQQTQLSCSMASVTCK